MASNYANYALRLLVLVVCGLSVGCCPKTPTMPPAVDRAMTLAQASDIHLALSDYCADRMVNASYMGPLAFHGRGLMATSPTMIGRWVITTSTDAQSPVALFSIRLSMTTRATRSTIATIHLNNYLIQLDYERFWTVAPPVDEPLEVLGRQSIRQFLTEFANTYERNKKTTEVGAFKN